MDNSEFREHVLNGDRTEYVKEDAIQYLRDNASFRVINKSALEKDEISQTEFVSISTTGTSYTDDELIKAVKEKMGIGADIQKFEFRHNKSAPTVIEIWRHGSGYSAFALSE